MYAVFEHGKASEIEVKKVRMRTCEREREIEKGRESARARERASQRTSARHPDSERECLESSSIDTPL